MNKNEFHKLKNTCGDGGIDRDSSGSGDLWYQYDIAYSSLFNKIQKNYFAISPEAKKKS